MSTAFINQHVDILLGQEFLTWLWFKSQTTPDFELFMGQKIVVIGGLGGLAETTSVSGPMPPSLHEAMVGLGTGKKVSQSTMLLQKDNLEWQSTLKASDFAYTVRAPRIYKDRDDDDLDATLLEKIYLLGSYFDVLDKHYLNFLRLRIKPAVWKAEAKAMGEWMKAGAA